MKKAIILFSGGLDSLIAVKLLKDKNFDIVALNFKLPFIKSKDLEIGKQFLKKEKIPLKIIDCTKSLFLKEYLKILKKPKHGTGSGINPCIDCKLFMINQAKKYAEKHNIEIIATGDVLDERPMSQSKKALNLIEKKSGKKIYRPLIEELKLQGKQRKEQIKLAEQFNIKFPTPGGGCLLCEKINSKTIKFLLDKDLINSDTLRLTKIGRHFHINNNWFIVGRNENENSIIETCKNSIKSGKRKPAVFFQNQKEKAIEIQKAY